MILYHYTCIEHRDAILREGITRGDVPTSETNGINAVWLTQSQIPEAQKWGTGGIEVLTDRTARILGSVRSSDQTFLRAGDTVEFPNKTAVRFTVKIPPGDRHLKHWPRWARKRLAASLYDSLDKSGGGGFQREAQRFKQS